MYEIRMYMPGLRIGKAQYFMRAAIEMAMNNDSVVFVVSKPLEWTQKISDILTEMNVPYKRYGKKYGVEIQIQAAGRINTLKFGGH